MLSVEELEEYFQGMQLPERIELITGVVIIDLPLFLESHFRFIRNNKEQRSADVHLLRLNQLHTILEAMK